ncbi:MAG: ABC transporter substrate-binding protein [Acidimicrobiia bacterium]
MRRSRPRQWIGVALAATFVLGAAACGDDDDGGTAASSSTTEATGGDSGSDAGADKDPYLVAYVGNLSGPTGVAAQADLAGFQAYVGALNERGGVDGHEIEIKVYDDKADVAVGSTVFREALASGAIAIRGVSTTAIHAAEAQLNGADGAVYFSPGFTLDLLIGERLDPLLFGTGLSFKDSAAIQLAFIKELAEEQDIDKPRIAIMRHPNPAGDDFVAAAEAMIAEYGFELVTRQDVALTAVDVSAQAQGVKAANPDFVLAMIFSNTAPAMVSALQGQGVDVPIVNYTFGSDEPAFERVKSPDYYAVRAYAWPTEDIEALDQLHADAKTAGVDESTVNSNTFSVTGYIGGMLLEEALSTCGSGCDRKGLAAALEEISDFDTGDLSPPLTFTADDHRGYSLGRIYQWDEGKGRAVAVSDWLESGLAH